MTPVDPKQDGVTVNYPPGTIILAYKEKVCAIKMVIRAETATGLGRKSLSVEITTAILPQNQCTWYKDAILLDIYFPQWKLSLNWW